MTSSEMYSPYYHPGAAVAHIRRTSMMIRLFHWLAYIFVLLNLPAPLLAAVVVLQNASDQPVECTVEHADVAPAKVRLLVGESRAVSVGKEPTLKFSKGLKAVSLRLDPYQVYLFGTTREGTVDCQGVEFATKMPPITDVPAKPLELKPVEVPVKLVADNKDHRAKPAWEKAYDKRLSEASAILELQCGIKFVIAETADWAPPADADLELPSIYRAFSDEIKTKPKMLALGYTLRVPKAKPPKKNDDDDVPVKPIPEYYGRNGLPWSSHILMREDVPGSEGERIEVLVHHLGWYVGAVTTPDNNSVMRVNLGDGRAARISHVIRFDPLNILIAQIWAEEMRAGRGPEWKKLSPIAVQRLKVVYQTLSKLQPDEIPIADYVLALDELALSKPKPVEPKIDPKPMPMIEKVADREAAIRTVVQAVVKRAAEMKEKNENIKGDDLTAEYVKAAAEAALKADAKFRSAAFSIGLGVALDDSTILRNNPITKNICQAIESNRERSDRLVVLNSPTLRDRRDLCQHFVVSMALAELLNAEAAELAGLSKELADMKGTSGFSFADLAVDYAGVALAKAISDDPKRLEKLQKEFKTADYVPAVKNLREGLSESRFKQDFGSIDDARFKKETDKIRKSIEKLPGLK